MSILIILDTNLQPQTVIDTFESLLWVERYSDVGDFEIFTTVNDKMLQFLRSDYYIVREDSEHVMIIEDIKINSDSETGSIITVSGRSLESILDRRIIWNRTNIEGNLQNGILKLLNENVIEPSIYDRKIENFVFEASTDPRITSISASGQYEGEGLLETIKTLCDINGLGFLIKLEEGEFRFKLYKGEDRSYDQNENTYVEFTPKFDNLLNSNYEETKRSLKTVSLVVGEGESDVRQSTTVGGGVDLSRREVFTDASDLTRVIDGIELSIGEYNTYLEQRGREYLLENVFVELFDGEINTSVMYRFNEDFFIGDIVQIANEYGMESKSRVTEIIYSESTEGKDIYPTFVKI